MILSSDKPKASYSLHIKLIILVILASILNSACNLKNNDPDNSSISGHWKWVKSTGGIIGHTITPETEGYDQFLYLEKNYDFTRLRADTVFYSGKYALERSAEGIMLVFTVPDEHHILPQYVESVSLDTLILRDECTDCYISIYARMPEILTQ